MVAYGQRGQVVMHRLDASCFLANVMERDAGIRIADDNIYLSWRYVRRQSYLE